MNASAPASGTGTAARALSVASKTVWGSEPEAKTSPAEDPMGNATAGAEPAQPARPAVGFLGNNADFASAHTAATTCESAFDVHEVLPPPATVRAWWLRSE